MSIRIIQGDVRSILPSMPENYFDCIVTSPPYFGLRDYQCEGQIGLEPTLDAYLETLVNICRELRRVLKSSGVCFLVIGDSYAANGCSGLGVRSETSTLGPQMDGCYGPSIAAHSSRKKTIPLGLKPKDLCLVPERLGFALQMDGWWVRSRIVWHKKNPMPESVTDRPTSAHETVWMLAKSERYFWDGEAVREDASQTSHGALKAGAGAKQIELQQNCNGSLGVLTSTRNIRNVWPMVSQPFTGTHFAAFPTELVERCIKAATSERGCCSKCGAPWERVVDKKTSFAGNSAIAGRTIEEINNSGKWAGVQEGNKNLKSGPVVSTRTLGWQPSCNCTPNGTHVGVQLVSIPARVLDPFGGSGTTGLVADRLGRDATLIELNSKYVAMARSRIESDSPLFANVVAG